MNENSTQTELLIKFLDRELEGNELKSLQEQLNANPELKEQLDRLRLSQEALRSFGLKMKIAGIHAEMMDQKPRHSNISRGITRKIFTYTVRIAAMVILVMGIAVMYQYFSASSQSLFEEKYRPFMLSQSRGSTAIGIETAYKNGNWPEVLKIFSETTVPDGATLFLAGNAFLHTGNSAKAIKCFQDLQQINNQYRTHIYEEDTEFYLALAYLAHQDPRSALPIFEKIEQDQGHPYHGRVSGWYLQRLRHAAR
jgi:tetratricopeptide (TPR) repeat protein